MKDFLIMSLLALSAGIILLISAIILSVRKKGGPLLVYSTLILFPIILLIVPILLVSPSSKNYLGNVLISVPRWIYSIIVLIFAAFILIKENIVPGSALANKENVKADLKKAASGIRLLHYSIFANILYFIPTFIGIMYIIFLTSQAPKYHTEGSVLGFFAAWGLILFLPLAQYYVIVIISLIALATLAILIFITSINGAIRINSVTGQGKKHVFVSIILNLLPIINVIYMLFLCRLGKKKLKSLDAYC